MSDKTQQDQLSEPFDDSIVKQVQGMDYVQVSEVVSRMNRVLGTGAWSVNLLDIGINEVHQDYVIAKVSVTATIDGNHCYAEAPGGKKIATQRGSSEVVDLSNDFKSAYSDGLKKACQRLGVGLHLARDDEAIAQDSYVEPDVSVEEWRKVASFVKSLPELKLTAVKEWWDSNGNGVKPTYETMTKELFFDYKTAIKAINEGAEEAMTIDEIAAELDAVEEAPPAKLESPF